jgi:hypothetical protein
MPTYAEVEQELFDLRQRLRSEGVKESSLVGLSYAIGYCRGRSRFEPEPKRHRRVDLGFQSPAWYVAVYLGAALVGLLIGHLLYTYGM